MSETQYLQLVQHILTSGTVKDDRTGVGTKSIFGYQMQFNLQEGFPLLTTKKMPFHLIKSELLWFLHGDTNIRFLLENNNHIWDEWAFASFVKSPDYHGPSMENFSSRAMEDKDFNEIYQKQKALFCQQILEDKDFAEKYGNLGPVYGKQWRAWQTSQSESIDQLKQVIAEIKTNPTSRRLIVSAWNPTDIPSMALPPCHVLFQFCVENDYLHCQLYQRSGDVFLGVPFNIASYALLTHLVAHECHLKPGKFIHTLGDAHLYLNHLEQATEQVTRFCYDFPTLQLNNDIHSIFDFTMDDIKIMNYQSHPALKGRVAV